MSIKITVDIDKEDVLTNSHRLTDGKERVRVSQYARIFDEGCPGWSKDPEANLAFLRLIEANANTLLKTQGYLYLNKVYELLGIPHSKAGQLVGWIYKDPNPAGDNYVDFDIYATRNGDAINGYARTILLDFNVDGIIIDKLP